MDEKNFRRRVIGAIARTQKEAADVLGTQQHSISAWVRCHPSPGSMAELLESALAHLTDEDLQRVLEAALSERSARV